MSTYKLNKTYCFILAIFFPIWFPVGCGTIDTALVKMKANTEILKSKTNETVRGLKEEGKNVKAAADTANLNVRADLEYGKQQYYAQHYDVARYFFDKVLLTLPDNFEALKLLGWSYFFQRQYGKALNTFLRTQSRYPQEPEPVIGAGWSYFGIKSYEKALEHFNRAEQLSGDSYHVHKGKGLSYLKLHNSRRAKEEFAKIFTPNEIEQLLKYWKEWKAGEPDSLINAVAPNPQIPSLLIFPMEYPRYRGDVHAHQVADPSMEIDAAWKLFAKGNYPKAIEHFKDNDADRWLDATNGLAWSYLRNDEIIKAEKWFRRIKKVYSGFKGAIRGLEEVEKIKKTKSKFAEYYLHLEKYQIALREFEKLASKYPGWIYPHFKMGDIYFTLKNLEHAQAFYQRVLALDPNFIAAQHGLDRVYQITAPVLLQAHKEREHGNFKTASWLYIDFIEDKSKLFIDPSTLAEAYNGLGWSYFGKRQYPMAIKKFHKARDYKKFAAKAAQGLGLSYYHLKKYKKAAKFLGIAHEEQPDENDIAYKLDWSILKSRGSRKAEKHFQKVLAKFPLRASSYMGMGWINYQRRKPDLAVEYFLKAISLDPDFAWTPELRNLLDRERFGWQVYNRFAWTYYHRKQYSKSLSIFQMSLERAPNKSDTLKGIGYTLFKQKKYRETIAWLSRSLTINPNPLTVMETVDNDNAISPFEIETSIRTKMGWSFYHLGSYDQGLSQFIQELKIHPNWSDVNTGLGWSYLKTNRLAEARAAFNLAVKNQPLNHSAHKGLNQVKQIYTTRKLQKGQKPQNRKTASLLENP